MRSIQPRLALAKCGDFAHWWLLFTPDFQSVCQSTMHETEANLFLAACVRQQLHAEPWPHWPEHWQDPEAALTVAQCVEFHGIGVLLAQSPGELQHWPASAADPIREEARVAGLWEETHRRVVGSAVRKLAEAGIRSILLKGTALAYLFYDDPSIRRRGDTDLLIRPADLEGTQRVLEQAGFYRREDPHGLYFQETWLKAFGSEIVHAIDLHWEPADRPVLQRVLSGDAFWKGTVGVPRFAAGAIAPDPVLMMVHGAVNETWHEARGFFVNDVRVFGGRRLIWSVDYFRLISGFSDEDWQRLIDHCKASDACSIVYAALRCAEADLQCAFPAERMADLEQAPQDSIPHSYILKPDRIAEWKADFNASPTLVGKAELVLSAAFPPRYHLIEKYPDLRNWPTALLQARRYAEIAKRLVKWDRPA